MICSSILQSYPFLGFPWFFHRNLALRSWRQNWATEIVEKNSQSAVKAACNNIWLGSRYLGICISIFIDYCEEVILDPMDVLHDNVWYLPSYKIRILQDCRVERDLRQSDQWVQKEGQVCGIFNWRDHLNISHGYHIHHKGRYKLWSNKTDLKSCEINMLQGDSMLLEGWTPISLAEGVARHIWFTGTPNNNYKILQSLKSVYKW